MIDQSSHVVDPPEVSDSYPVDPQVRQMCESKLDLLKGTLDIMVLQTLASMGPVMDTALRAALNVSAAMNFN